MKTMEVLLEKLESLSTQSNVKILDVGGWHAPCRMATHMMDIMPFETINWAGSYGPGENNNIAKENYLRCDLNSVNRFPFADNEFDFVVCKHTLEDIRDPIAVAKEISRVAKAGYIETPHRTYESTRGVERPGWVGHYHHRWMVVVEEGKMIFQMKPHNIHSRSAYYFRRWPWLKVKDAHKNAGLLWEGSFQAEEKIIIDYGDVKKDLIEYKKRLKNQSIFRYRWSEQ